MNQKKNPAHVNSLAKGLSVLAATNELAPARVADLVKATALPKATLVRLLKTLVTEGYVSQQSKQEGGGYVPAAKVRELASVFAKAGALGQTAQPYLNNLCEIIKWPTDLMVRDGLSMLIEASNRENAPLGLKRFEQKRFPLLNSSAGQAFLAWQRDKQCVELISAALALHDDAAPVVDVAQFQQELTQTRERGYALRNYDSPIEGTRVISVPVLHQGSAIAVLTMVCLRDVLSMQDFEQKVLAPMQQTAEQIARDFARFEGDTLNI